MLAFEQFQTKGTSCQTFTQDNFSNAEAYHSQYTLQRQHGGLYHLKIDSSTSSSLLFFRAPSTLFDASLQTQRANRSQTFTVASAPCQETHHLLWGIDWIKKKKKKFSCRCWRCCCCGFNRLMSKTISRAHCFPPESPLPWQPIKKSSDTLL